MERKRKKRRQLAEDSPTGHPTSPRKSKYRSQTSGARKPSDTSILTFLADQFARISEVETMMDIQREEKKNILIAQDEELRNLLEMHSEELEELERKHEEEIAAMTRKIEEETGKGNADIALISRPYIGRADSKRRRRRQRSSSTPIALSDVDSDGSSRMSFYLTERNYR